jgi:xanthine dehydrogenase YagR molybdenum-binding subunit
MILESAIREAEHPTPPSMHGAPRAHLEGPNPLKGHTADELDMIGGRVVLKADPSVGVPLEIATLENLVATFDGRPPQALWVDGKGLRLDTMNTVYCEVAVDTELGEVEVLRFGVACDPGKVMRPTSLESQIDQVLYFSQGAQLFEDCYYDKKTGVQLNSNMIEYKKPGMLDVPVIDKELLESRAGNAAYGANGISHSMANTHLVILAIHNATGVWVDPPATPDKVLAALGKA